MAEENTDKSVQNSNPAATTGGQTGGQKLAPTAPQGTRVPEDTGKPKKRRRRRRRRKNGNAAQTSNNGQTDNPSVSGEHRQTIIPDSVYEEQVAIKEVTETSIDEPVKNNNQKKPVNQKKSEDHTQNVNKNKSDKQTSQKVKTTLAGKQETGKQKQTSDNSILQEAVKLEKQQQQTKQKNRGKLPTGQKANEKNNRYNKQKQEFLESRQEKAAERAAQIAAEKIRRESERENSPLDKVLEEKEPDLEKKFDDDKASEEKERFTPHLTARDLKTSSPTFSLQDIQRGQRRRRLIMIVILLIVVAAGFFLWRGWNALGGKIATEKNSPTPVPVAETSESAQKATLSGVVNTSGLHFPSQLLDRIAIWVSYGEDTSWRDTGIRLVPGEQTWQFTQAMDGETYNIQAVLIDNGREIAYSNTVSGVTAPSSDIVLSFPANEVVATQLPTPQTTEPRLTLEDNPSISGRVSVENAMGDDLQVVVWLGPNQEGSVRQDAYVFTPVGDGADFTISDLEYDREYVVDAIVQTKDGQVVGVAPETLIAKAPAAEVNFRVIVHRY